MVRHGRANDSVGRLVVFEGPDGVGKTTLAKALVQRLRSDGMTVKAASFPGRNSGSLAAHIYRLYHNPDKFGVRRIDQAALQVLLTAAHVEVIRSRILPALRNRETVILDRFWWSTWVYGTHCGVSQQMLKRLLSVEELAWASTVPRVVFLVTRKQHNRELGSATHNQLTSLYRTLARREAERRHYRIILVDNSASLHHAIAQIRSRLK